MNDIFNIEVNLKNYNKFSHNSIISTNIPSNINLCLWYLNTECNYKCPFCGCSNQIKNEIIRTPHEIENAFNKHGKQWIIFLTSLGEPFLYPKFLEIIKILTKNNYITINSNLSHPNVYSLPSYANLDKLIAVHAAYHVIEIEKNDPEQIKKNDFIKKINFLQNNGINTVVSYVAYPPLLKRIENDFNLLRSKGIKNIMAKPFRGMYQNKNYPKSYSKKEWALLIEISNSINEVDFLDLADNYKNYLCDAGYRSFFLDQKGDLFRCRSDSQKIGNFFSDEILFSNKTCICGMDKQNCLFACVLSSMHANEGIANNLSLWRKIFKNY